VCVEIRRSNCLNVRKGESSCLSRCLTAYSVSCRGVSVSVYTGLNRLYRPSWLDVCLAISFYFLSPVFIMTSPHKMTNGNHVFRSRPEVVVLFFPFTECYNWPLLRDHFVKLISRMSEGKSVRFGHFRTTNDG
jgi:hypothetical protein